MPDLEAGQRLELGARIDRARKLKGWTLAALGAKAGYDERTIGKVVRGEVVRLKTVYEVCSVLGIDLEQVSVKPPKVADERHGGYNMDSYSEYLGQFCSVRRNFTGDGSIFRSIFELRWSDQNRCIEFTEHHRYVDRQTKRINDYTQTGEVFISNQMGLIHLTTVVKGAVRLLTMTKLLPPDADTMEGVVVTQSKTGAYMRPSVSPIFFTKLKTPAVSEEQLMAIIGPLFPHDDGYVELVARLNEVEQNTVLFASTETDAVDDFAEGRGLRPMLRA